MQVHHAGGAAAPQQRMPVAPTDLLLAVGAQSSRIEESRGVKVHHARRGVAPQQRMRLAPSSRTGAISYLLPPGGAQSARREKPAGVGVEVHHALPAAAPQQRMGVISPG